ncbi:hypothetical protein ACP70R_010354 [Stipagrostis hirtigluma subsp. patula]
MATNSSTSPLNRSLSATSSRYVTQGVTATHNFEVTNFSLLDGIGIGECVYSPAFTVGGCEWCIEFFPDGDREEHGAAYASAFLRLHEGPPGARTRVKFSFSLYDKDRQVSRKRGKRRRREKEENLMNTRTETFDEQEDRSWGSDQFFQKSVMRDFLRASGDCFTIRCVLCVIKSHMEDADTIQVPQANLHHDLACMLKDGNGADVTFSVGDQLFHGHRCVLAARSMVFKAELFGAMKETSTRCIKIDDMEPAVFEGLLHFIYTDSLQENCNGDKIVAMQHLLVAADRYGLDRLKL